VRELLVVTFAALTSCSYALSTALQTLAAREAPGDTALRASLLAWLARRRVWLGGAALALVGWGFQATALALGSLALVQPALGLALIVLLVFGVRLLHESVGTREIGGAVAIAGSVAILAWAAPTAGGSFTHAGRVASAVAIVLAFVAPFVLRVLGRGTGLVTSICAGFGWACVGVGTALVDAAVADGHAVTAVAWGLGVAGASLATLVSEMTALQTWPATRAIPIAFSLEMIVPAAAAPFLTTAEPPRIAAFVLALAVAGAGALALGSSRAVAERLA
jgi:drug/metabolite transporter (DMT)-like permease